MVVFKLQHDLKIHHKSVEVKTISGKKSSNYSIECQTPQVRYWSVARTDSMPNWYLTFPNLQPSVVTETSVESLHFVADRTRVEQVKRYDFDRYMPFTPQVSDPRENYVFSLNNNLACSLTSKHRHTSQNPPKLDLLSSEGIVK